MSRTWRIVLGVLLGLVALSLIAMPIVGHLAFGWDGEGWRGWFHRSAGVVSPGVQSGQEVRLVDDNGDGVPDRGVIENPATGAYTYGPGGMPMMAYGRPVHRLSFLGGLPRLLLVVLVVGAIVWFVRRGRRGQQPPAPTNPPVGA